MRAGRDTAGSGWRRVAATVAAMLTFTGCGVLPGSNQTEGPCPDQWRAAALWSTQNGSASTLSYVKGDGSVEERALPYLGFEASRADTIERRGTDTVMVSNGNLDRDKTHIVTVSATCAVTGVQVDEAVALGVATSPEAVFTTGWLNGAAWIHRHDPAGTATEIRFPGLSIAKPVAYGSKVYAFATEDAAGDAPLLLVLDATSLTEVARVPLSSDTGSVFDALVKDGTLYYPLTGPSDGSREGDSLGAIDLTTLKRTEVPLEAPSPYLLAATDDAIYIGHTFMNNGYRPMTEYVWITRYTPSTGKTETFDVGTAAGIGINAIAATSDSLYVLGTDSDSPDSATLLAFDTTTMTTTSQTRIPAPSRPGHHYLAGLIVP